MGTVCDLPARKRILNDGKGRSERCVGRVSLRRWAGRSPRIGTGKEERGCRMKNEEKKETKRGMKNGG